MIYGRSLKLATSAICHLNTAVANTGDKCAKSNYIFRTEINMDCYFFLADGWQWKNSLKSSKKK
jgi:hypothetical protein